MGRSFLILSALVGFLAGVLAYLVIQPPLWLLTLLSVLFLLFSFKISKRFICIFIFLMAFCLGLSRGLLSEHRSFFRTVDFYNELKVEVEGIIKEVDIRRDHAKYKISVRQINLNKNFVQKVQGDILVTLDKFPPYEYGDRVELFGELKTPGDFDTFSYSDYLSRYGVYSVMYRPQVDLLEKGQGSVFWRMMTFLQNRFMYQINQIFPEPYASFEAGLLVGARKGIPDDLMEKFNITGLTHIIAISGYNITIIIVFVMAALKGLPRKIAFMVAILAIVLFTLFVGASPAVVRASIMGILGLIALNYGRQNNIHLTILYSAVFMVMWNPKILWWDVGFQLSFMAVMGLIYVAPLFEKYSQLLPEALGIRESIQMTMAAQVMALPVIVFNFERLSLIAPIANLLVAFALPLAMLFGFIAVIFSFFFTGLSLVFGYITSAILLYIIKIIEWTSLVPYASIDLPGMKLWMLIGYYIFLGLFLWWWNKNRKQETGNRF